MKLFAEFVNRFNRNNDLEKVSTLDIQKIETELKIKLPVDYKKFIVSYGNVWTPNILDIIVDNDLEINDIQDFWNIKTIISDKNSGWTANISENLIPFASDSMGNIFSFLMTDLKTEKETVPIYFFDHDFNTVERISGSFYEWINEFNNI